MPRGVPNTRQISTGDLEMQDFDVIDMTTPNVSQKIETVEAGGLPTEKTERLAFMEEPLIIVLEPTAERNPRKFARTSVNGDTKWVPVGVPVKLRRKHVEVFARCQPFGVRTDVGTANEEDPHNKIIRAPHRRYPFTVRKDPSPLGELWLRKVSYEG